MFEPGVIVLLGSGEIQTSPGELYDLLARRLPERPRIAILETPAGFEPTSALMAGAIERFLKHRFLQSRPQHVAPGIDVVPARRRGTVFSPDDPEIVAPLLEADAVVLGPGSGTYTVRQLRDSRALQIMATRQRRGAALVLSSAAALAFSTYTLPVYAIHEGGAALHWKQGLDFFGRYGLPLSVIPHWDKGDGVEARDVSRYYLGRERFRRLHAMLPAEHPILGIDEDAALVFDFARRSCRILGTGSVTFLRNGLNHRFPAGATFPMGLLGLWRIPDGRAGIPRPVWEQALQAESEKGRAPVSR